MDRTAIVDAVSEVCRHRTTTHVLLSPDVYQAYLSSLTYRHKKAGIRASMCHHTAIIVVDGMINDAMFSFSAKRIKAAKEILNAAVREHGADVMDMLSDAIDSEAKWLHVAMVPQEPSDEATGKQSGDQ